MEKRAFVGLEMNNEDSFYRQETVLLTLCSH